MEPTIIAGDTFQDERGQLAFVNDFDMTPVKRFYVIFQPDTKVIRAWQGHQREQKWFSVLDGAFEIRVVRPDSWSTPSAALPVQTFHLSAGESQVLHIPGGFANGFRAMQPASRLIVYSDLSLTDAKEDDFRFEKHLWTHWD